MPLDSIGYLSPTGYVETKIVDADGEVLRAIEFLNDRGWCQHTSNDAKLYGPVCLMGALYMVDRERTLTGVYARRMGFASMQEAIKWNDEPERTKAEVIARLRSAAEQGAS